MFPAQLPKFNAAPPRIARVNPMSTIFSPNCETTDVAVIQRLSIPLAIGLPVGVPSDGQLLEFRILDDGTSRALTFHGFYVNRGQPMPVATTINKWLRMVFEYNKYVAAGGRWDLIGLAQEV